MSCQFPGDLLHLPAVVNPTASMCKNMGISRGTYLLLATAALVAAQSNPSITQPITGGGRIEWAIMSTISLPSFGAGLFSSGWGTYQNQPTEYGVSLKGFEKRFGMRLTGVATSNTMEAGLGAIWGEDPRYQREAGQPFGHRVRHVVKMTFMAPNRHGRMVPAYARYAAISGSNVLSNTWRPDSDATANHTMLRIGFGFLGDITSNAFFEFWPDVKDRFFH
jgi:hypothetical protein